VEAGCPVGDRAYSSEGLRDRGINAGGGRAENDYENEERERWEAGAEDWPKEYTEYTERGMRGGNRGNGKGGRIFFTTKHPKDTKGGGRNRREVARGAYQAYAGFS
jgi:hypothetical protein